ncbi:hypothetical protein E2C01_046917 [Portunus trituberculatus]|uniref:Uncharacterized protein n=1 Tax=Portunus trituberculatus TaxID=210409 RepID=A0A5B7G701_PORTR|nr:hypothetical protein [Portunus trituberculatus]
MFRAQYRTKYSNYQYISDSEVVAPHQYSEEPSQTIRAKFCLKYQELEARTPWRKRTQYDKRKFGKFAGNWTLSNKM